MDANEVPDALRRQTLEPNRPIADLLRTCITFASHVGSSSLRHWAVKELRGYGGGDTLPGIRTIPSPRLYLDGYSLAYGLIHHQATTMWELPQRVREMIPDTLELRQPIHELEAMVQGGNGPLSFQPPQFPAIATICNLEMSNTGHRVDRIYFTVAEAQVSGIVDQIRTTLIEMVADLTEDVPIGNIPNAAQVETIVHNNIRGTGSINHITITGGSTGAIAAGTDVTQIIAGELARKLTAVRDLLGDIDDVADRASVEQAVEDLEAALSDPAPDTDTVRRRGRILQRLATAVGTAALTTAATDLVQAALATIGVS